MGKYSVRRTTDLAAVKKLHVRIFGIDTKFEGKDLWLVWEKGKTYPVGFCTGRASRYKNWYFLARGGLLPEVRGKRLQRRLIAVREAHARRSAYKGLTTFVANWNSPSLVNLLKSGFTLFDPRSHPKRDGYVYLGKKLRRKKKG